MHHNRSLNARRLVILLGLVAVCSFAVFSRGFAAETYRTAAASSSSQPLEHTPEGIDQTYQHVSRVSPTQPSPMDGIWKADTDKVAYRINLGRLYPLKGYEQSLPPKLEAGDVVAKDLRIVEPGVLSGYDVIRAGVWTGTVALDGTMTLVVATGTSHFRTILRPVLLDNQRVFSQEIELKRRVSSSSAEPGHRSRHHHTPPSANGASYYPPDWTAQSPKEPVGGPSASPDPQPINKKGIYPPGWD